MKQLPGPSCSVIPFCLSESHLSLVIAHDLPVSFSASYAAYKAATKPRAATRPKAPEPTLDAAPVYCAGLPLAVYEPVPFLGATTPPVGAWTIMSVSEIQKKLVVIDILWPSPIWLTTELAVEAWI